ncbi:MAG: OB-fold nucleic acid binding domain-containing protein [Candidatus Methanofastidiosia archaeon]
MRRRPALEREICELSERDYRVSIIGTVTQRDSISNSMTIDDGTGYVRVSSYELFEVGSVVRVLGRVISGRELFIESEMISDFSKFDLSLYKKIQELEG